MNKIIVAFFVVLAVFSCKKETENFKSDNKTATDYPYYFLSSIDGDTISKGIYGWNINPDYPFGDYLFTNFYKLKSDTLNIFTQQFLSFEVHVADRYDYFKLNVLSDTLNSNNFTYNIQNLTNFYDSSSLVLELEILSRITVKNKDTIYDSYGFSLNEVDGDYLTFNLTKLPKKFGDDIVGSYSGKLHHYYSKIGVNGKIDLLPLNNQNQVSVSGKFSSIYEYHVFNKF